MGFFNRLFGGADKKGMSSDQVVERKVIQEAENIIQIDETVIDHMPSLIASLKELMKEVHDYLVNDPRHEGTMRVCDYEFNHMIAELNKILEIRSVSREYREIRGNRLSETPIFFEVN